MPKDKLSEDIIKASKAIRRKQLTLKMGRSEEQSILERQFKPITEPLQKLLKKSDWNVKQEVQELKHELPSPIEKNFQTVNIQETPPRRIQPSAEEKTPSRSKDSRHRPRRLEESIDYTPFSVEEDEEINKEKSFQQYRDEYQSMVETQPNVVDDFLEQYDILPRVYIDGLLTDTTGDYDITTGPHFDPTENKLKLGKAILEIDGNDIVINGTKYKGTAGLYELIFKAQPSGFNKNDEMRYREILKSTHVHHRNYDPKQQVKGSKSHKHINIIKPLLFRQRTSTVSGKKGGSIGNKMLVSKAPYQYVYWDDINELVDRLKLLIASEQAGHTSHTNEIASIVEELKEEGIIY